MNRIFLLVILLISTMVSSLNGKKCLEYPDVIYDLSGRVESPTNDKDCLESDMYCSWKFYFPTDLHHTMFRMTFTTNFVQSERNLVRMGGGDTPSCCWRSDYINFKSVNDEICWITYNSDLCLDRIKQSGCETRDWGFNVTRTMVLYICEPAKAQFNLSYEYFDCITGNTIESPETTSQPTTYPPLTTTVAETAENIKTPSSHYGITNTVTEPSISSQATDDCKNDPMTISPQTIGMIIGMIVMAFILQITAFKAYFYWKNRNRSQERQHQINTRAMNSPLPVPTPTPLYEEVNNPLPVTEVEATSQIMIPIDNAGYLSAINVNTSRTRNTQASPQAVMASSSQGEYEVAYVNAPESDYITPETLP
ncbi:uncharacterized protein LOC144431252 [Styela clava]